jgi:hypothetical protein
MEGIEKFSIVGLQSPNDNVKGLTNEAEIVSALSKAASPASGKEIKYRDKDGAEQTLAGIRGLVAEPIFLKGVPFRMEFSFVPSPGFALANPQAVFPVTVKKYDLDDQLAYLKRTYGRKKDDNSSLGDAEKEVKAMCSVALVKLALSSISPVSSGKIKELAESIKEKYWNYKILNGTIGPAAVVLQIQDYCGGTLAVDWMGGVQGGMQESGFSTATIVYSHDLVRLKELYRSHLSKLEEKATSKKPDKSNDL